MKIKCTAMLAALTLTAAATPALADPTTDDVRCYVVYLEMSGSADATVKTAGTIGGIYYMGRLDGRTPDMDLESAILTEIPKLQGAAFAPEAKRCGDELQQRGAAASALGKDLQQKGADMMQQQNSN